MNKFTFYHVTDVHVLCPDYSDDEAYKKQAFERMAALDTVFDQIIADTDVDTVVISGDEAHHGRYTEHKLFIEHAHRLLDAGKKVYLTTATHDFGLTKVDADGRSEFREGVANRRELRGLYDEFGFKDSISEFDELSYVAKPCEGFRILCLNDDGGAGFSGYSEKQKEWIAAQVKDAKENGDYIFAVTHHPVNPPSPVYPAISKGSMLGDYENMSKQFADMGIKFVFTGHTHMHSIRSIKTDKGNVLYDINTGTISEFPFKFRKATVYDNGEADIETVPVGTLPFDTQGRTASEYFEYCFDSRILNAVDGMENDFDKFVKELGSLAINANPLRSKQKLLKPVGKILNNITVGGVCRLILSPSAADKSIKDMKFKCFLAELIKNTYRGDEPYAEGTPVYRVVMAIVSRIYPFVKKKLAGTQFEDLKGFLATVLYDPTPDSDAHLK